MAPVMSRGVTPRTLVGCRTSTAQTVHLAYGPLASGIQRTLCGLLGELKDAQVAAAAVSCSHCRGLAGSQSTGSRSSRSQEPSGPEQPPGRQAERPSA